ncbi:Arf GTPase activating protein [Hesseltinella vesiculosa]|uniref:Arf GTPase activating protein n=1 Tax=Hesseltinella vesiculosa TaxID=101127 RepID=A0A1X2GJC7_9FUNG|nr:Arf GTPase activating protein [Hesseltinella vesiculosa]
MMETKQTALQARKLQEVHAQKVKELLRLPENKKCFDCPIKSPFFVNVTLQTFICSRCSGLIREVGHRVKSISVSTFTGPEILALEMGGNGVASTIWLHGFNAKSTPEPDTDTEVREFMRQKYYDQKWLLRDLWIDHDKSVKRCIDELFDEDGLPKPTFTKQRRPSSQIAIAPPKTKHVPAPLTLLPVPASPPAIKTAPLHFTSAHQPPPIMATSPPPQGESPVEQK